MSNQNNEKIIESIKETFDELNIDFNQYAESINFFDRPIEDAIDITERYLRAIEIEKENRL